MLREIERALIIGAILGLACSDHRPDKVILFTGSLSGYLEACTCPGTPVGGLNTVAHLIKQYRKTHPGALAVDAGLFTPDTLDTLNAFYMARAMQLVGYDVVAPGPRDENPAYLALWKHLPVLTRERPCVVVNGVVFARPDCEELPEAMYTVVLSQNEPKDDSACARRLEPDAIINARPGPKTQRMGKTLVIHPVPRGMALGVLRLSPSGASVEFVPVEKTTPSDPDVDFVLGEYSRAFRAHLMSTGPNLSFKGPGYCRFCHQEEYSAWKKSAHARAFETLLEGDEDDRENPWCLSCHTTGYGQGGFENNETTPHLAGVGCESCHRGGHCPDQAPTTSDLKECLRCHTPEQSPDFNEKEYWNEIRH